MHDQSFEILRRIYQLTRREIEVLDCIAIGHTNKAAGSALGISPRTVEIHRARGAAKIGAQNTATVAIRVGALAYQFPDAFPRAAQFLPSPMLPV